MVFVGRLRQAPITIVAAWWQHLSKISRVPLLSSAKKERASTQTENGRRAAFI